MDQYLDDKHSNIKTFIQPEKYGKTLEYQIVLDNPSLEILLTDSISNKKELSDLMELYKDDKPLTELLNRLSDSKENIRIKSSLQNANERWTEDNKKKALIASRYLNSIGKGENALELAATLKDNLELKGKDEYKDFVVPDYIAKAIQWVCE